MLFQKNILLISPEPWDHIFVSKHHYAIHLAQRGNKVFFLNPPGRKTGIVATAYSNVYGVFYTGFPRGLRYYPRLLQRFIIAYVYRRLVKLCRCDFDLVWSFDNSVFYDFSVLPATTVTISHIVDSNQDFQTQKAASTADFCFCISEAIRLNLIQYRRDVFKVNHGFHPSNEIVAPVNESYGGRFKAVYAGNLSIPYIDWNLLSKVIHTHLEVDFIFIGPKTKEKDAAVEALAERRNVFFVGQVSTQALAGYYRLADVLLVSYQEKYHADQTSNTHKMMEYLGSGKVIVATKTAEYRDFFPLIVMSEHNSEWTSLFADVITRLSYFNDEDLRRKRIQFAMDNTYDIQINKIERIIAIR